MSEQLALSGIPDPPPRLTANQQAVWDLVREPPGWVSAERAGALVHSIQPGRWSHPADMRCEWCAETGRNVLRSKGLRPLVIRRRTGLWEPRDKKHARSLVIRDGMASGLPGTTWEEIFGGEAA